MSNVMEVILRVSGGSQSNTGAGAFVTGASAETDVWITSDILLDAASITELNTDNAYSRLVGMLDSSNASVDALSVTGNSPSGPVQWWSDGSSNGPWGSITANTWYTVEFHNSLISGTYTQEIYIDGVSVGAITLTGPTWLNMKKYQFFYNNAGTGLTNGTYGVYYRNIKVGTTRGADDIFDMGTLSSTVVPPFTSEVGGGTDVLITADPATADTAAGFLIAFDNGPLDDPVTWTRIDDLDGVSVQEITIDRGRSDERSKTNTGQVTVRGIDTVGVLDPTNSSGPYFGKLDPVKQAGVKVYNPETLDWHWLFRGYIDTYSFTLDTSETYLEFEITLVDMLDMLNDAEITPDQAGNTVPNESVGDCFYTGEHVDDRLLAVLADTAVDFPSGAFQPTWPASLLQIASGNVFVQGRVYANRTSLLQVIDEACDGEFPGSTNRFCTKDGAFAFRGRYYRFAPGFYTADSDADRSPGSEMVHWYVGDLATYAGDATFATYTGLKFQRGKTNLINCALVTPLGITDTQLASGSNFFSDATSIGDYGPRTSGLSLENLITGDADDGNTDLQETASFAQATVENYKDPVSAVSELTFRNPQTQDSTLAGNVWAVLTGIELSDWVTVKSNHPGGGGFLGDATNTDHFVESIKYQLEPLQGDVWNITLTVGLSSRDHFTFTPSSWQVPGGS